MGKELSSLSQHLKQNINKFAKKEQAALLTSHAEAKRAHHIADFLPKEELERFEQKVKAIKAGGTTPTYEDYASNKIDQSNIGFKMLMKQGWQAGTGLGKSGDGIAAPINKYDNIYHIMIVYYWNLFLKNRYLILL